MSEDQLCQRMIRRAIISILSDFIEEFHVVGKHVNTHGFRLFSLFVHFYMKKIWRRAKFGATLVCGNIWCNLQICSIFITKNKTHVIAVSAILLRTVTSYSTPGGRSFSFARTSQLDWIGALRIDGILIQNAGRIATDWIKERHSSISKHSERISERNQCRPSDYTISALWMRCIDAEITCVSTVYDTDSLDWTNNCLLTFKYRISYRFIISIRWYRYRPNWIYIEPSRLSCSGPFVF